MLVVCCISGASGSGKSTLARLVADMMMSSGDCNEAFQSVHVISQDSYFTAPFIRYSERKDNSFENGHGIDWDQMVQDMNDLVIMSNNENGKGHTDHEQRKRTTLLVVEGHILGNATEQLFQAFGDCSAMILVYLDCSPATCKARRLSRRHRTAEEMQILGTYIDTYTNPCFVQYGLPAMQHMQQYVNDAEDSSDCSTTSLFLSTDDPTVQHSNCDKIVRAIRAAHCGDGPPSPPPPSSSCT